MTVETKTKHTPMPWRIMADPDKYLEIDIVAKTQGFKNIGIASLVDARFANVDEGTVALHIDEIMANAQFIIKACNNHYVLLGKLKDALKIIECNMEIWGNPYIEVEEIERAISKTEAS